MTTILGVDPGLHGALAFYRPGAPASVHDMPIGADGLVDGLKLAVMCNFYEDLTAFIEQVSSMPRQAGAFNFGFSAGAVFGAIRANGVPVVYVPPNKWKLAMGLKKEAGETYAANKTRARALASELFPNQAQLFSRVKDDGRAEALLIAVYGHEVLRSKV